MASSPRRSAVTIAAVLTSDRAANAIDSPMITHTPQAPLCPSVRTVSRYCARVRTRVPGCGERARSARHEHGGVGGDGGVAPGERAVDAPRGRARRRGRRSRRRAATPCVASSSRAGTTSPTSRWPSAATTSLIATDVPRTLSRSPSRTPRSSVRSDAPSPAAAHGASQPVRPLPSRNTCVGTMPVPPSRSAVPAGSGPPSRPVTTCAAVTRASVTPSVSCRELVASTPCVPTSIAISTIGVASAALRQRLADSPVLASSPAGPSARSGRGEQRGREPEQPAPEQRGAAREQDAGEDRERRRLLALEQQRHRGAAAERDHAGERAHDAGAAVLDRDLAQRLGGPHLAGAAGGGDDRELGDADAHPERGDQRDPGVAGGEAGRHVAVAREQVDERVGERAAGQQAERARHQRDEQRLGGDQAADLARRRPEGAQHRGLPPALGDHERERAGDHEQRHEAGDAAHRAEDRDQRLAVARLRVAGVGVGRVGAVEHVEARPAQPGELRARLGDDADRVDAAGRAGERVRGRGREEHRGLAAVLVGGAAGDAGDPVGALAARRGEVEAWRRAERAGASRRRRRAGRTARGRR